MQKLIQHSILALGLVAIAGPASAQQPRQNYNPPAQVFSPPQQSAPQSFPQQRTQGLRQQQQQNPQTLPPGLTAPRR